MTPVLEVAGLAKDYGDGLGLRPFDLVVDAGELVVLVGPNGAGKSTLLRLIAGLLEPSAGTVQVAGEPAGSLGARAATSWVPDTPVLYDDLSVEEHLEYVARLHDTTGWEERAASLLETLHLADRASDLPIRFSRGLRQKTSLAVGLIRPFQLLLIDEPFVGLDLPAQATLVEFLTELAAAGTSVIVSTHQLDLAERASRCIGLRDGGRSYDGPVTRDIIRELVA